MYYSGLCLFRFKGAVGSSDKELLSYANSFGSLRKLNYLLRAGFWYGQVSPISVVERVDTPILFIHGKRDRYVPTEMSRNMYKTKKNHKAIYLVAGATHAQSCVVNKKGYENIIKAFIDKYIR